MFCGMNFTTTGIEFRRSEPSVLRVEYHKPLTSPLALQGEQLANRGPIFATKASQTEKKALITPQAGGKRAAQASSAEPKRARKGTLVEDPESSSSPSSTSSSPLRPLSSLPSFDRRSAEPSKAKRWSNANARSWPSYSSSSSLSDSSRFCEEKENDTSEAASAGQLTSNKLKSFGSRESHEGSQPVKKKANKGFSEKRVRFAMDVQERVISSDKDPQSEDSSSDGSECSYIDPSPPTEQDGASPEHTDLFNPSGSRKHRPVSMTTGLQPAKHFADKPTSSVPLHSRRQSAGSKGSSGTRPLDPVIVIWSDLKKSNVEEPSSQPPAVVKTALKNSFAGQCPTAFNDDKENALQYDKRLELTFWDV